MSRGMAGSVVAALLMLFSVGLVLFTGAQNASAQYTAHDPILIIGDGDFKPVNGVKGGAGTQANPYRIEGWDVWGSDAEACVEIRDTTAFFVIRDCAFQIGDGAVLLGVSNGTVSEVTTYACSNHVRVENSTDVRIELNTMGGSGLGVCVKNSTNVQIVGNGIDGLAPAFFIQDTSGVEAANNHGSANDCIDILNSTDVTWTNDTWTWVNHRGVLVDHSNHVTVDNSTFTLYFADGASVVDSNNCSVSLNTFTGQSYYWMEGSGVSISDCDNVSAESNTMVYRNAGIVVSRSVNAFVYNNTITSSSYGIVEGNSTSSLLANNTVADTIQGILSTSSRNCSLIGNNLSVRDIGVSMHWSHEFVVMETTVAMYGWSMTPMHALECNDSLIYGNTRVSPAQIMVEKCVNMTVMNNSLSGEAPLSISECTGTMVLENNFVNNTYTGIYVRWSYDTYIAWNVLDANQFAIYLDGCTGGQAFANLFPERNSSRTYGILTHYVADYEIWGNELHNCESGIGIDYSVNVSAYWNDLYDSSINLYESPGDLIMNNTFWGGSGVGVSYNCSDTMVLGNEFLGDGGIALHDAIGLYIMENIFNRTGVEIWGTSLEAYDYHLITPDNLVHGNPIIQVTDSADVEISDMTVGQLIVVNCENVLVSNVSVDNTGTAILIAFCLNATLENNVISDNSIALRVYYSLGVMVHHNWFIDNGDDAYIDTAEVSFNLGYPGGGNYWYDYSGVDAMHGPSQDIPGPDGLGDTVYDKSDFVDYYPVVGAFIDYQPTALFSASTSLGDLTTDFVFDAGISTDDEGSALMARWDFDGDGTWDTDWSSNLTEVHRYTSTGTYTVRLEIMDTAGNSNITTTQVMVVEVIPEFGMLPLMVALTGISVAVTALWTYSGSRRRKQT